MRLRLAIVGAGIALIGVAVLLVAFSLSSGTSGSVVENVRVPAIGGHTTYADVIPASLVSSASVVFAWASTQSVEVALYDAVPCANATGSLCPGSTAIASWWSTSGVASWTGAVTNPWYLEVVNPNASVAAYNGTLAESYPAPTMGGDLPLVVLLLGAVALMGIGALALFLGMFLRGGVYEPARPPVPPPDSALFGPMEGDEDHDDLEEPTDDGFDGDEPD